MQASLIGQGPELDGSDLRIGIVQARFNAEITQAIIAACAAELKSLKVQPRLVHHITVPGALEIPLALLAMAETDQYDALIAVGCVIRGETYHFEVVANECCAGISRLSLDHGLPIANAVLTVESQEQAQARAAEKGREAARVAIEMAQLMEEFS